MDADTAELQTSRSDAAHYKASSLRENLLEHLFVVELLRTLWSRGAHDIEILKAEVDGRGCDVVLDCNGVLRYVQLKSSHRVSVTAEVSVNLKLADEPGGCVLWLRFDQNTLELGPFLWFGGKPGDKLPPLGDRIACHSKGDSLGVKKEGPTTGYWPRRNSRWCRPWTTSYGACSGCSAQTRIAAADIQRFCLGKIPIVKKKPPNPTDKYVGSKVRMRRMLVGMTQEKLGDALGLTFQQVQKYEKGTNRISASRLQHLARILQVPVSFFFDGAPEIPGLTTRKNETPSPAYVSDFLATSDGLALTKAFTRIRDSKLRRRIVDLVEQISGQDRLTRRGKHSISRGMKPKI